MKNKILYFILISIFLLVSLIAIIYDANTPTNAQNYDLSQDESLIRVGISTNDFSQLEYNNVQIGSCNSYKLTDKSTNTVIANLSQDETVRITIDNGTFTVFRNGIKIAYNITGPIGVSSNNNAPIRIIGLQRAGKPALYRGEFEVIKAPTREDKLSVVNILSLEDYLKGVVPNEIPVSFGLEAVKAQAIAARNYAIRPRVKSYPQFDICDSVQCQVYFGYNSESSLANKAIDQTKGLFALYDGEVILALYSSTAGGYTENYDNAFADPLTNNFPGNPLPYLKGKPDIEGMSPLFSDEDAANFYESMPETFDNRSSYFRWTKSWTRLELENILNKKLAKYSNSGFVEPKLDANSTIGTLQKIIVLARGVSGKAMLVEIDTDKGRWLVKKELMIRQVFQNGGKILPSANVIFKNIYDDNENLIKIVADGGGLGHGVGMSQFGAGYLSKTGHTFVWILQHYYDGIAIGTWPVILNYNENANPITQKFYGKSDKGDSAGLMIDNKERINNFKVIINSNEINLSQNDLAQDRVRVDIGGYIKNGINEIIFCPPGGDDEGKSVKVWVEVVKARNDR